MSLFIINNITIYPNCLSSIRKNLKPDKYVLNSHELSENFFSNRISISAIVGMNGSGKSTLLDILIRMSNNLGAFLLKKKVRNAARPLYYVDGIYADICYQSNGVCGRLCCRGKEMALYYGDLSVRLSISGEYLCHDFANCKRIGDVTTQKLKQIAESFFYTIVTNYSIQAFVSSDYREDNCYVFQNGLWIQASSGNWLQNIFDKNDGYLCPLNINPYRYDGSLDIAKETVLVNSRLTAILLYMENLTQIPESDREKETSKEYICGYRLSKVEFSLSKEKITSRFDDIEGETIDAKYNRLHTKFEECYQKKDSFARIILDNFHILPPISNVREHWDARLYLVQKVLTIASKYPAYAKYSILGDAENCFKEYSSAMEKSLLKSLGKTIREDSSHISIKVRQVLNFIEHTSKSRNMSLFRKTFTFDRYEEKLKVSCSKKAVSTIMEHLPPSYFEAKIIMRKATDETRKRWIDIPLNQMSSGERQFMFMTSSVIYHLLNLNSVGGDDAVKYKNYNIILDELELCFHPEYQRMFLYNLIGLFRRVAVANGPYINVIMTTHSPFLLSDIPQSNILYLEDGSQKDHSLVKNPFCANVSEILREDFFLRNGFVGKFAQQKVHKLISFLKKEPSQERNIDLTTAQEIVRLIAEPLVSRHAQNLLLDYIDKYPQHNNLMSKEECEKRIDDLKNELETYERKREKYEKDNH